MSTSCKTQNIPAQRRHGLAFIPLAAAAVTVRKCQTTTAKGKMPESHGCQLENRIKSWCCFGVSRGVREVVKTWRACLPFYLKSALGWWASCSSSVSGFVSVTQTLGVWSTSPTSPVTDGWRKCRSNVARLFKLFNISRIQFRNILFITDRLQWNTNPVTRC